MVGIYQSELKLEIETNKNTIQNTTLPDYDKA